jgi:2-polyprenyl-3-methyl-5-hydroxy-6-metoxy-1,4-benzoquinol methylase
VNGVEGNGTERLAGMQCIACASSNLVCRGKLPVYDDNFLGRDLDTVPNPGFLYECLNCRLRFRNPLPAEADLMNYYQGLDVAECWQHGPEREVWRYIKEELASLPEASILDVGCFRGDLLHYLGESFRRYGIEPSLDAAAEAERRGVTIVGQRIEDLQDSGLRFGAITLIDVAEHLTSPLDALKALSEVLLPNGKLMVFTGSTDALAWRLAGLDYYYSAMPEHLAFMNPAWFDWAAPELDCKILSIKRLRYEPAPWSRRFDEAFKNILYISYRRTRGLPLIPSLFKLPIVKRIAQWPGSWWTTARDHILVTLVKR